MKEKQIIECVPNFSEGRNKETISKIADEIRNVEGVKLLDIDSGYATNRTVMTFVGEPDGVIEAAFKAIIKAAELIDMRFHKGEHPRMGATDVCPLIPISGISMEDTVNYAVKLAKRVGENSKIPVYLYGYSQPNKKRNDLSVIRDGEYEGFSNKIKQKEWKPDFGNDEFNLQTGATVIGARDFLIAYNVNLNSKSSRIANRIAFDVREAGRVKRKGNKYTGEIELDKNGEPIRIPGKCKDVKAIGWYIEEYGIAQISANLVNFNTTPIHVFFDEVCKSAETRGVRITGSELVGLVPLKAITDAGKYYLNKQGRSIGVSEKELIQIAVKSLGLDELTPFEPEKKIIEYCLENNKNKLVNLSCLDFADVTASETTAPGGGSVAALCGALGASLSAMVANVSANKKGWEEKFEYFGKYAQKAQELKKRLLWLVDEDTKAFAAIIEAFRMQKTTENEIKIRKKAIESASLYATEIPLLTMDVAAQILEIASEMIDNGNKNTLSDGAAGVLCCKTAVHAAYFNVIINAKGLTDKNKAKQLAEKAKKILDSNTVEAEKILKKVDSLIAF
ncbi:MAG: glutamate formimidoyltransferase [Bacteroidetes bacterium]|nr:glutamate formimidoyltransferase [Bacteroidota bacterium]